MSILKTIFPCFLLLLSFHAYGQIVDTFYHYDKGYTIQYFNYPTKFQNKILHNKNNNKNEKILLLTKFTIHNEDGKIREQYEFNNKGLSYFLNDTYDSTITQCKSNKSFLKKYGFDSIEHVTCKKHNGSILYQRNFNKKGKIIGAFIGSSGNPFAVYYVEDRHSNSNEKVNLVQRIGIGLGYPYTIEYFDNKGNKDSSTVYENSSRLKISSKTKYKSNGEQIRYHFSDNRLYCIDSADMSTCLTYTYDNRSYISPIYKNNNIIYEKEYQGSFMFRIEEKVFDAISKETWHHLDQSRDSIVILTKTDTIIASGKIVNKQKYGKWNVRNIQGKLLCFAKYPPYNYAKDTLNFVLNEKGNIELIVLYDTLSHDKLKVINYENPVISTDSVTYVNDQNVSQKRYYSNKQICFEIIFKSKINPNIGYAEDSIFIVYDPIGNKISEDVEKNVSYFGLAEKEFYNHFGSYEDDFWYRNKDFILKKRKDDINLIKEPFNGNRFNIHEERKSLRLDKNYLAFSFNDYVHLFDNRQQKIVKPYMFQGANRNRYTATNHPLIIESIIYGDWVDDPGVFLDTNLVSNTNIADNGERWVCIGISKNADKIFTVTETNDSIFFECGKIKSFDLSKNIFEKKFYKKSFPDSLKTIMDRTKYQVAFINDTLIYTNVVKDFNVFSTSGKFSDSVDIDYFLNKCKILMQNDTLRTLLNVTMIDELGKKDTFDISIPQTYLQYNEPIEYKWYSKSKLLYYSLYGKFYLYDLNKRTNHPILDSNLVYINKWGDSPEEMKLMILTKNGYEIYNPMTKISEIIFPTKMDTIMINILSDSLIISNINNTIPLKGVVPGSNFLEENKLLEIKWYISMIKSEMFWPIKQIHRQNDKLIYIDEFNSQIYFYNPKYLLPFQQFVILNLTSNANYVFTTPDQYYMFSQNNAIPIHFEKNYKIFPLEQFDLKFNRPDIIIERLGYADSTTIISYHSAYLKRLKKMNFTEEMLKDDFHLPEIKIKNFEYLPTLTDSSDLNLDLDIKDSKYKLDRINIFINDVPVFGTAGIDLRKENIQKLNKKIKLSLSEGENKIQVSVLNQAGAESYKETAYITYKPKKSVQPNLYLVTIGDSKYSDSRYDLTYASKDATDIKNAFEKNSNSLYGAVYTFNYVDAQVTKENILKLKSELLKAKRDDVVLITVAGHGVLDKNLDYYLATHDMDFSNPSEKGLPYEELESLLDGIAPLKKVLFLDACHSGEVDKEEVELLANNTTTNSKVKFRNAGAGIQKKNLGLKTTSELMSELFTDLRRGTGATVISSAGGAEYAMESDEWKNGLFTYCLLHGLQDKAADENKDGQIMLSELQNHLRKEVTSLSNGAQQPTSRIENLSMDFRVW